MSQLSHAERATIAAGGQYTGGSGNSGPNTPSSNSRTTQALNNNISSNGGSGGGGGGSGGWSTVRSECLVFHIFGVACCLLCKVVLQIVIAVQEETVRLQLAVQDVEEERFREEPVLVTDCSVAAPTLALRRKRSLVEQATSQDLVCSIL